MKVLLLRTSTYFLQYSFDHNVKRGTQNKMVGTSAEQSGGCRHSRALMRLVYLR